MEVRAANMVRAGEFLMKTQRSKMPASNVFNQIVSKFDQLKKAWEGKKLPETDKLLLELKIAFACNFGHEHESNEKELLLIREVYKIGAQSMANADVPQ